MGEVISKGATLRPDFLCHSVKRDIHGDSPTTAAISVAVMQSPARASSQAAVPGVKWPIRTPSGAGYGCEVVSVVLM
jgi:hypothetical protein